ncbi:MAG: efflux RND transporter periplasmic adaptor subunit, partial [Syntrophomonas sp.]|uniref:efflux RND transporter periplasmic adaptor subunit n=1 Tax=Syntrophomonas sp. TaxID=2053627 RepID=UPI002617507C
MKGKGKSQGLYLLLFLLISMSMLATGCGKEKELVKESALTVNTAPAEKRDIAKSMRYSGMVRGENEVYIMPKIPARVTAIHVQPGQRVRVGQVLLSLDSKDLNVAVKQAEAGLAGARAAQVANELSLENARKNFERNEELHKAGAISDSQFEAEKLRYESLNSGAVAASVAQAEAALASLQNQMESCNLTSPIDGLLGSINLSLGETANPQMPAAIVTDTGELEIELLVSEAEVSYVQVGSAVDLSIEAAGEKPFKGQVKSVSVVPDPVKRSYSVKVSLSNADGKIKSGM